MSKLLKISWKSVNTLNFIDDIDFHQADSMLRILLTRYPYPNVLILLKVKLFTCVQCHMGKFGRILPWRSFKLYFLTLTIKLYLKPYGKSVALSFIVYFHWELSLDLLDFLVTYSVQVELYELFYLAHDQSWVHYLH